MDFSVILAILGAATATFLGGKAIMKVDAKREDRAEEAIDLSNWCSANGLPSVSILLKKFAVKDYSGVLTQFRAIAAVTRDELAAKEAVRTFFQVQLGKQLAQQETAEEVLRMVEDKLGVKIDRPSIEKRTVSLAEVE